MTQFKIISILLSSFIYIICAGLFSLSLIEHKHFFMILILPFVVIFPIVIILNFPAYMLQLKNKLDLYQLLTKLHKLQEMLQFIS